MKWILPLLALLAMPACNTVAGAGKDIQAGGAAVTSGARDVQKNL